MWTGAAFRVWGHFETQLEDTYDDVSATEAGILQLLLYLNSLH